MTIKQCLALIKITKSPYLRDKFDLKSLIEDIVLEGKAETGKM